MKPEDFEKRLNGLIDGSDKYLFTGGIFNNAGDDFDTAKQYLI